MAHKASLRNRLAGLCADEGHGRGTAADNAGEKAEKGGSVRREFEHRAQRRRQLHDADQRGDLDNFR